MAIGVKTRIRIGKTSDFLLLSAVSIPTSSIPICLLALWPSLKPPALVLPHPTCHYTHKVSAVTRKRWPESSLTPLFSISQDWRPACSLHGHRQSVQGRRDDEFKTQQGGIGSSGRVAYGDPGTGAGRSNPPFPVASSHSRSYKQSHRRQPRRSQVSPGRRRTGQEGLHRRR